MHAIRQLFHGPTGGKDWEVQHGDKFGVRIIRVQLALDLPDSLTTGFRPHLTLWRAGEKEPLLKSRPIAVAGGGGRNLQVDEVFEVWANPPDTLKLRLSDENLLGDAAIAEGDLCLGDLAAHVAGSAVQLLAIDPRFRPVSGSALASVVLSAQVLERHTVERGETGGTADSAFGQPGLPARGGLGYSSDIGGSSLSAGAPAPPSGGTGGYGSTTVFKSYGSGAPLGR